MFEFGELTTKVKKTATSFHTSDSIIYNDITEATKDAVVVILDTFYPSRIIDSYVKVLKQTLKNKAIVIICSISKVLTDAEIKRGGVIDFYIRNTINIKQTLSSIPNFSACNAIYVSCGRAIYGITQSDTITVEDFYDFIFNKTYFYAPSLKGYVFPINSLFDLFKNENSSWLVKDCSLANFALFQYKFIETNFSSLILESQQSEDYEVILLNSKKEIDEFLYKYMDYTGYLSWDIETDSLDFFTGHIGCITLAMNETEGYFLPLEYIDNKLFETFMNNKKLLGQNLKFDNKYLWKNDINIILPFSDTMILGQTLCECRSNSLKSLAWYYTKLGGYDEDLNTFKKKYSIDNYLKIPQAVLLQYATLDAILGMKIHNRMQEQLSELDEKFPPLAGEKTIRYFYEQIMMPSYQEFFDIEYQGMYINTEKHNEVATVLGNKIKELENIIYKKFNASPLTLKLSSAKQLGIYIGTVLKWKNYGTSKAGEYLTGEDSIVRWIKDGCDGAKELQEYRSLNTLMNSFVGTEEDEKGWREFVKIHPDGTARMHANFGIGTAETKRNTCRAPNLTNVPSHGENAELIKGIFATPNDDYMFGTLDYSSLQIRLCAINSDDPVLCKAYTTEKDADLHSTTGYGLIKAVKYNFVECTQDDKKYSFYELEKVKVLREGKEIVVLAKDLLEADILNI